MSTAKRVFYAIAKDNLHTRREIASALGCSFVTVSKSVDKLISCGLVASVDKNESDAGRRSDFLDVSPSAKVLLINLCTECFGYISATLYDDSASVRRLQYIDSLDFEDNLILLINDIKKRSLPSPLKVAVALPGDVADGRIVNPYIDNYSGFNVTKMMRANDIDVDIIVSAAKAIEGSSDFSSGDTFVSISKATWGTFGRGKVERFGQVTVDNRGMLTFDSAMHCSYDENSIKEYSARLLGIIGSILSPKRIFFSSELMSDEKLDELANGSAKLMPVNADEMILDGLMELSVSEILNKI